MSFNFTNNMYSLGLTVCVFITIMCIALAANFYVKLRKCEEAEGTGKYKFPELKKSNERAMMACLVMAVISFGLFIGMKVFATKAAEKEAAVQIVETVQTPAGDEDAKTKDIERTITEILALATILGVVFIGIPKVFKNRADGRIKPGQTLPEFSAIKLDGEPVTSADLRGKPSVILFFENNPESLAQLTEIDAAYKKANDKFNVLAINSGEQEHYIRTLLSNYSLPMLVFADPKGTVTDVSEAPKVIPAEEIVSFALNYDKK